MRTLLILPIGVTGETVQGILNVVGGSPLDIITVTTAGFEEVKKEIIQGVKRACELIGAEHHHVVVDFGDVSAGVKLYKLLKKLRPSSIVVSGITGSRYLLPLIISVVLRYWYETKVKALLIHGVEGGEWNLTPLTGFFVYDLKREQREVFMQIYNNSRNVLRTNEDLIKKYGYGKSIYKVLSKLEEKGLIKRRRNKIEKTLPGRLLYLLLREAEGDDS